MLKNPNLVRYDSLASLKEALQRAFGRATPPSPKPISFAWLRVTSDWRSALQSEGATVVVLLRDRRIYVGKLAGSIDGGVLQLELWGCGGAVTSFPIGLIAGAAIVGSHDHREERAVRERQRRGEPAHMHQGPLKRERRGGIAKGEST